MRRLFVVASSLSLYMSAVAGVTLAQESNVQGITTNADGSHVTSTAANPTANGEGGTIIYGDINTGPGYTVVEPPTVAQSGSTTPPAPVAAPAPVPESVSDTTTAETAPTDTAVAAATDQDADNYADELEPGLGLDPANADTDADGVADGDELNLYGTDPLAADTDGDGVLDGEELFGVSTDPLVWEDFSVEGGEAVMQEAAETAQPVG